MKTPSLPSRLSMLLTAGLLVVTGGALAADGPVTITAHPTNLTVLQGSPATFSVSVDGTPPFQYQWIRSGGPIPNATNSSYTLASTTASDDFAVFSVLVTNALGNAASTNATLGVDPGTLVTSNVTLIPISTHNWRYFTAGTDLGTAWREPGFPDAGWSLGVALLGVEAAGVYAEPFRTTFSPYNAAIVTYYFRTHFLYTPSPNQASVTLNVAANVDDGAVWYLNGTEVGRLRVPDGQTAATLATGDAEGQTASLTFSTAALLPGDNVLAVEVHQQSISSSDIVFGMNMVAEVTTRVPDTIAPTVVGLNPPATAVVNNLTSIEVFFSEGVDGIDTNDLRINGNPVTDIQFVSPSQIVFEFPQPATGVVTVAWASGHGITDRSVAHNPFAPAGSWTYTLDPNASPATFVINEFLAVNSGALRDEDGDDSDWIEVLNPGQAAGNLQGWHLTDNPFELTKWEFPYYVLSPGQFVLVFASGKDRTNLMGGTRFTNFHSNFQLNASAGSFLALVDPNGNIVSSFIYTNQSPNISFGRDRLDPGMTGFFSTPTPRAANSTSGAGVAPAVRFSRESGTFVTNAPFQLTLTAPGASIYYSFGTNVPRNVQDATSFLYTGPINVSNTLAIRARAFAPNLLPGPVTTKIYIGMVAQTNVLNFNSPLPILVLHNYGQGTVPANSDTEQYVFFEVFDNDTGRSSLTNRPNLTGRGIFHARGSSTLTSSAGKASFFMEARDEINDDLSVPLMGLPDESDWVLYAPNNFEPALIHNPLAHALYRDRGRYASRTRFFELFIKDDSGTPGPLVGPVGATAGDYHGIYVLEEKIKRDDNRVNISRLDVEDNTLPAVSGGYLMSIDRTDTGKLTLSAGGGTFNWLEPAADDMTNALRTPQINYMRDFLNAFNTSLTGVNYTNVNSTNHYSNYIDFDSWIDLHITEVITFNVDAMRLSGYWFKDRNKKMSYGPTWDYDRTQGSTDGRDAIPRTWRSTTGDLGTDFFNFSPWWGRLFTAPDFWQAWIDRYQELRRPGGGLTTNNIFGHIQRMYNELAESQPRERTRWNITTRGTNGPGTSGTYLDELGSKGHWYGARLDFADTNFLAAPGFSLNPGLQSNAITVVVSPVAGLGSRGPAGSVNRVFVSLDGVDPRLSGGGIRTGPNVLSNNGPITVNISNTVRLFARSWNPDHRNLTGSSRPPISSPWSGPMVGTYHYAADTPPLRVTEIMYHPPNPPPGNTNDADNFEYIEFRNISGSPLNVNGYRLRGGVEFNFPNLTLADGQHCLVVANLGSFSSRYNTNGMIIAGAYTNDLDKVRLGNGGDSLRLEGAYREPILDFSYSDDWYPTTDGAGFSLQIVNQDAATHTWGLKESWRPSGQPNGTPGAADSTPVSVPTVYINEILTRPGAGQDSAIELYNPNPGTVDVSHWYLTDEFDTPRKYRIPAGMTIAGNSYKVFLAATSFGASFGLDFRGEEVYLFSGDANGNLTGYVHGFDYGAQTTNVAFGRYINSTGGDQFPAQATSSLGNANGLPSVGPVVVSEISYHPPDIPTVEGPRDNERDEYIELQNITATDQPLYDPARPGNTWRLRDAVEYTFPSGVTIPAGGFVVVTSIDPSDPYADSSFRFRNGIAPNVALYGPWQGKLDNSSDSIELVRPDAPVPLPLPDAGTVYDILVDKVNYSDSAPWPLAADGIGPTLQRVNASAYGNDASNWVAAARTPGSGYGGGSVPVITQDPTSVTTPATLTVMFSVTATGPGPLSYQWRYNGSTLPNGGNVSGATSSLLVISNVRADQAGQYQCVVINTAGSAASSVATLTVLIPANITSHPMDIALRVKPDPTAATTTNATFAVGAMSQNPPLTYQWLRNGTNLPGATSSSLTIVNVTTNDFGVYACAISDLVGTIYSSNATLYPLVAPGIVIQPISQSVPINSMVSLSVVATGFPPPFGFEWRISSTPLVSNVTISPVNLFSFMSTNDVRTNQYRVVVKNRANLAPGVASAFANIITQADSDGDGIPDDVENSLGFLNPNDPSDANGDKDLDGMKNGDEIKAGTNPDNPNSYLRIDQTTTPGLANLVVATVSNRTYTVQYTDRLPAVFWSRLRDIPANPTNRVETIPDPAWTSNRFYRVALPHQP